MEITLLHPSRGRAQKAFETYNYWISRSDLQIEYILSLDSDDLELPKYQELFKNQFIIINDNKSVVEATNAAAKISSGKILVYLSDDFKCPAMWDKSIRAFLEQEKGPALLKVDDCLQNFGVRVLTVPIINRQFYEKLGYFWHPGYRSMFVDEDLYNTAEKLRALKFAPQLKFPHEHVCNGKAPDDETYRRSSANWNQGQEFFKQRKAAGFPL